MASCNLVKVQVVRGIVGIGALIAAYFLFQTYTPLSYLLVGVSLFAMKGCPVCWIFEMSDAVDKSCKNSNKQPE
jgi:hypothetical protein